MAEIPEIPSASTPPEIPISSVPRTPGLVVQGYRGIVKVVSTSPWAWFLGSTVRESAVFTTPEFAERWVIDEQHGWPQELYRVELTQVQTVWRAAEPCVHA